MDDQLGYSRHLEVQQPSQTPTQTPRIHTEALYGHAQQRYVLLALAACNGEPVRRVGFLHTASAHVETFDLLVEEIAPSLEREHLVKPKLLQRAQLVGATDRDVRLEVCAAITEFRDPAVVLCTYSTIGSIAEACGSDRGIRVLRVDRPMAELAVRSGHKIAVVAALASTLAPTRSLLESIAREACEGVEIVDAPCLDAWPLFEAGDEGGFHRAIADHIETLDPFF